MNYTDCSFLHGLEGTGKGGSRLLGQLLCALGCDGHGRGRPAQSTLLTCLSLCFLFRSLLFSVFTARSGFGFGVERFGQGGCTHFRSPTAFGRGCWCAFASPASPGLLQLAFGAGKDGSSHGFLVSLILWLRSEDATARPRATFAFLDILGRERAVDVVSIVEAKELNQDVLEIVVVSEFLSCHDTPRTGKKGHSRLTIDSPFDHLAIWLTRMIDEPSNGTTSGIDDGLVIEAHQIVALPLLAMSMERELINRPDSSYTRASCDARIRPE